ncbi:DsbA family oxidoreductase [Noviherbaspirillum autotrophicum]|uniref:DSBA oxidoreductase n=1 Tax=Noviherbaspirillum autotrophicum TaxID=709839 RepID=A0A0C1YNF4_9BURK|nr:DsbA family oxidoreductase [Noviherbaspirillum autotrophicum]KIF82122.1 DSBA oxidoreductase [Noviherbaspirillum autotrophicum]
MSKPLKIDFVSDVSCPWCAIGLKSLEHALQQVGDGISAELHFQPFELNPQMPAEGQDIVEHLTEKYGITPEQVQRNSDLIRERGESVGFEFRMERRNSVYNTFDAHRLLHWAELEGRQRELKHALLRAYFTEGDNPASHEVLARLAGEAGLDVERARDVLASGAYAEETRAQERFYLEQGIHSVPAVIINDRYLISGGQPAEVFEQALRQVAAQA